MVPRLVLVALFILTLLGVSMTVPFVSRIDRATAATNDPSLTKNGSGLVARDSLTKGGNDDCSGGNNDQSNINQNYWNVFGDAIGEGANWSACEDSTGLWLGVQAPASGDYAGIYTESPNEDVMLYHTDLTIPSVTINDISADLFNTGLYVQTSDRDINYVTCYGQVNSDGSYYWRCSCNGQHATYHE